jgi:hypothetical protein
MGYELHITRKTFWADPGDDISQEEWRVAIDADPELELHPAKGPNAALWKGTSTRAEPLLDWAFGNVVVSDPDRPLIDKMVGLAARLEARVQGVNGEFYNLCDAAIDDSTPTLRETISSWFKRKKP